MLDELSQLIKQYEKKWDIQTLPPYQLSYNYVAPAASSDSRHVVLKISFPDNHEFTSELEALKFYSGDGSIRIVKEDRENGAVLLEKWLAIDPKGVIGEREFELGTYLRNPLYDYPKGSNYKKLEINRILQFSEELGFEKERILNWSFANAVISLIWFLEDEKYFKEIYIRNAELLHEITI